MDYLVFFATPSTNFFLDPTDRTHEDFLDTLTYGTNLDSLVGTVSKDLQRLDPELAKENARDIHELQSVRHSFDILDRFPSTAEIQNLEVGRTYRIGHEWYIVTESPLAHGATIRVGIYHRTFDNMDFAGYAEGTGTHPAHGEEISDPGNVLAVFSQFRVSGTNSYTMDIDVARSAFRAAKGSNEASGDLVLARYMDTTQMGAANVDTSLAYYPTGNYTNQEGIPRLAFRGVVNVSGPLPLVALGGRNIHIDVLVGSPEKSLWPSGSVKTLTPLTSDQALAQQTGTP